MRPIWVPDHVAFFTLRSVSGGEGLHIQFFRIGERPADDSLMHMIEELPAMMSRADVMQQMSDKPLSDRVVPTSEPVMHTPQKMSKYHREIKRDVHVDVYDVLGAFTGHYNARIKPMVDHLLKKLLAGGERGHKDLRQDMVDVRDSAQRAIDTIDEWG